MKQNAPPPSPLSAKVASRSALVVVRRIEQRDEEVLARLELDFFPQQIEEDKQRPFRDLALLGDARATYEPPTPRAVSSTSTTVVTASTP